MVRLKSLRPACLTSLRAVLTTLMSRPALSRSVELASSVPPMLSMSVRALSATASPVMRPPRLRRFSPVSLTAVRPAMVPELTKSPLRLRSTALAAISVPLPSRSPGFTRT
ncbi:hypothetical protein D9M68_536260 [compost metagenome]